MGLISALMAQQERKEEELKRETAAGKSAESWFKFLPEEEREKLGGEAWFRNQSARDKFSLMQGTLAGQAYQKGQQDLLNAANRTEADLMTAMSQADESAARRGQITAGQKFYQRLPQLMNPVLPPDFMGLPPPPTPLLPAALQAAGESGYVLPPGSFDDLVRAANPASHAGWNLLPNQPVSIGSNLGLPTSPNSVDWSTANKTPKQYLPLPIVKKIEGKDFYRTEVDGPWRPVATAPEGIIAELAKYGLIKLPAAAQAVKPTESSKPTTPRQPLKHNLPPGTPAIQEYDSGQNWEGVIGPDGVFQHQRLIK